MVNFHAIENGMDRCRVADRIGAFLPLGEHRVLSGQGGARNDGGDDCGHKLHRIARWRERIGFERRGANG